MLSANSREKTTGPRQGRGGSRLVLQFSLAVLGVIVLAPPALSQGGQPPQPRFGAREDNTTFPEANNIRFFGVNDLEQCEAACAADPQCRAYTLVKRGAFSSNPDNAVCYLSSFSGNPANSPCCISAVKVVDPGPEVESATGSTDAW